MTRPAGISALAVQRSRGHDIIAARADVVNAENQSRTAFRPALPIAPESGCLPASRRGIRDAG
jgi:hypothetical protein